MKVIVDNGAYTPERAHSTDAGLDLKSPKGCYIPAGGSAIIRTGVHVELPEGCAGLLVSKSGLNTKFDITSTGLVDEQYQGEIVVKLYNHGKTGYQVHAGDKVTQLVVIQVRYEPVEIVEEFDSESERGNSGFGSSGR